MDVHIFDHTLKNFHIDKGKFTIKEKNEMFSELLELLDENGKNGLQLIIKDIPIDKSPLGLLSDSITNNSITGNFDETNNMYADDIMAEICSYIMKESYSENKERIEDVKKIISNINEQLSDMFLTGRCSSGRVIRLWQIYYSITEIEIERKSIEKVEKE
jgi:hypothetical protein